eukprot:15176341-Alexandrium_andersonii.AAC.1
MASDRLPGEPPAGTVLVAAEPDGVVRAASDAAALPAKKVAAALDAAFQRGNAGLGAGAQPSFGPA